MARDCITQDGRTMDVLIQPDTHKTRTTSLEEKIRGFAALIKRKTMMDDGDDGAAARE